MPTSFVFYFSNIERMFLWYNTDGIGLNSFPFYSTTELISINVKVSNRH